MELEASIADTHSDNAPQIEGSAFHTKWQPSDSTFLQPTNLAIPKVQRAWERKALSPFSRQRLRVGKVWKRAAPSRAAPNTEMTEDMIRAMKRRKPARASSPTRLKPVKKMCLESSFGMGARVLQWEGGESPARKIVTRSGLASDPGLVALPDQEEEEEMEEAGDVTVEVFDEGGQVVGFGGEEDARDGQQWEDYSAEHEELDELTTDPGEISDGASIHSETEADPEDQDLRGPNCVDSDNNDGRIESAQDVFQIEQPPTRNEQRADIGTALEESLEEKQITIAPPRSPHNVKLPEGFVSPVKRLRASERRAMKQVVGSRRRTLPVQFAPIAVVEGTNGAQPERTEDDGNPGAAEENSTQVMQDDRTDEAVSNEIEEVYNEIADGEQEWEDVEDEASESAEADFGRDDPEPESDHDSSDTAMEVDDQDFEHIEETATPRLAPAFDFLQAGSGSKLPSSPIPSIEGQHPRLPLRRSPRRKSSSPLKQSTIMPSTERPHLVAFTPIKGPASYPSPSLHPGLSFQYDQVDDEVESPIPERAASAPPEEPQMSPQKPARPRVSDDTALLQAFLNRAAENKTSRRISTTKRESITNLRDSDAVRQALASPAKADVLADLDPNSPSPRKPSALSSGGSIFDGIPVIDDSATAQLEQDEQQMIDDSKPAANTRRSSRAGAKVRSGQSFTPAAPNKISIRGNADGVVLKRSEAQETATLTRNNTRKNKGGAILPPFRLTKIALQNGATDAGEHEEEDTAVEKPDGRKGVKWAETLVEFYQGGEVSELSTLSDEPNDALAQADAREHTEDDTVPIAAPPPPAETPSKPKIRRLKAPRTAATPGRGPQAAIVPPAVVDENATSAKETEATESVSQQPPMQQQAKPTPTMKKRSRIATPAKGLGGTTLLSSEGEPHLSTGAAESKQAPAKKKALISKLPAPASSTAAALGQGKENQQNLISSPPKKRTAPAAGLPTAKTFAPKLDFGASINGSTKTKLEPGLSFASSQEDIVPRLSSPAKKGGRSRNVLASSTGSVPSLDFGTERKDEVPGLSSPAKKRTKRAG